MQHTAARVTNKLRVKMVAVVALIQVWWAEAPK